MSQRHHQPPSFTRDAGSRKKWKQYSFCAIKRMKPCGRWKENLDVLNQRHGKPGFDEDSEATRDQIYNNPCVIILRNATSNQVFYLFSF